MARKWTGIGGGLFLSILLFFVSPAPVVFLTCGQSPRKADAIVLLVGPGYQARQREAQALLAEGLARYLIIPAHGRVVDRDAADGNDGVIHVPTPQSDPGETVSQRLASRVLENTNRELLHARKIMAALGLKSANVVSSPYHMRRIKVIAGRVFPEKEGWRLTFVPSRYDKSPGSWWWRDARKRRWVWTELVKLGWFYLYSPFCG